MLWRSYLRATGNRDAASRGWGTHLTALSSVATQHQGDSLRRLAMHAPQPRSLIHAPIAGRSKLVDVVAGQRGRDTALDASRGEAGAVRGAGTPVVITTALGLLVALLLGCASTTAGAETHTSSQSPVITTTAPPATASPAGGQSDPSRSGGSPTTSGDPAGPGAATVPGTSPNDVGSEAGSGAPGTPGSATPGPGQDVPARTVPAERMRAVFVGEPCVPSVDSVPRQAVNGLLLYCGQADSGQPRWGVASPPPPQGPVVPVPGTECDARTDGDGVVQGADGRLVACIRDLDGSSRWSDAS